MITSNMFGISLGEISLAALIAFLIFGPKEAARFFVSAKKVIRKIQGYVGQAKEELGKISQDIEQEMSSECKKTKVIDINGIERDAYSLEEVESLLKKRELDGKES